MIALAALEAATGVLAFVAARRLFVASRQNNKSCPELRRGYVALTFIGVLQLSHAAVRFMV